MKIYFFILFFLLTGSIDSPSIFYTLQYEPGADVVKIEISFNAIPSEEVNLIIPRSGPGTYEMTNYLDALLGLLHWTKENQRAFKYDEILPIMSETSGVDLSEVWDKW